MSSAFGAAPGGTANAGADLKEIETELLGFQALSGEDKLRLLPSPWPTNNQPPPSASLLSIASTKGLVAAAAPDTLVLATTEGLRKAYLESPAQDKTKSFQPQATISIPRVNQVVFSSDEAYLVITAEQGGGLAVYETNSITNGGKDSAFQIATNGASVRQLVPNPNPSSEAAHLFAVVLESGQLLLADLNARQLKTGASGNLVLQENITCACWSRLGKQIIAGRNDGTAVQVDTQGNMKAEIPAPPQLPNIIQGQSQAVPLTSISWLETHDFLLVHSPPKAPEPDGMVDDTSAVHFAHRDKATNSWTFETAVDPSPPFIQDGRSPAHHFMQRLRDWPPNIDDMVVILSTLSPDVGMLAKTNTALDHNQESVFGTFCTTLPVETRRAGLPVSAADDMSDTSAIGMAIDLSVKELVRRPIPTDEELEHSPTPCPALYVLNNEGMLKMWWIVNNAAIKSKTAYPDLVAAGGPRPLDSKPANSAPAAPATTSTFGSAGTFGASTPSTNATQSSAFGKPGVFGASAATDGKSSPFGSATNTFGPSAAPSTGQGFAKPATPTFGASSFGSAAPNPSFGGPSGLGNQQSPWSAGSSATSNTAAKPAFGSASTLAGNSAFGQAGGLGMNKPSPWGASSQQSFATFGQSSTPQSPFAVAAQKNDQPTRSGFAAFSSSTNNDSKAVASPFASMSSGPNTLGSPWQSMKAPGLSQEPSGSTVSFGNASGQSNSFSFGKPSVSREETMGDESAGGKAEEPKSGGLFGLGSNGFKLGSTFKGDGTAKDDLPKPKETGGGLFGFNLGESLESTPNANAFTTPQIKQEPGTVTQPKIQDIPAATPSSNIPSVVDQLNYKPKRFTGDLPPVDVPAEREAPQDPLNYKAKRFTGDIPPSDVPQETGGSREKEPPATEAPLAGSPPIDLGSEKFSEQDDSVPAGPEDDDDDDLDEDDEDADDEDAEDDEDDEEDEGEEESDDVDEEEDDGPSDHEVTDTKGLDAFMSRLTPASPQRAAPAESTTPSTEQKSSYTPAGFPIAPVNFAPPGRVQESPRSPSPQRAVTSPVYRNPAPTAAPAPPKFPAQPRSQPPQRIAVSPVRRNERPAAVAPPPEPEAGQLEDEEDARVRELLSNQPQPTKELPHFLAHQDYVGGTDKNGVGGQIERVFRDINSMIDTLGLNAHNLQGFVRGHQQLKKSGQRSLDDLDNEEAWTLDEVEPLKGIQDHISELLQGGRLEDVEQKCQLLQEEDKDVVRLHTKVQAIRKQLSSRTDPSLAAQQHAAPLPIETQMQQSELRKAASQVHELIGKVEETLSLLRADIASSGAASATTKAPTVEAIINTVRKMTAMIQQKSADIDVLEAQIRRLPNGLPSLPKLSSGYEDDLINAMHGSKLANGSPRASPARNKRTAFNGDPLGMSGMFGSRYRTPPSGRRSVVFSPEASMLGRSTNSLTGSGRKKMNDVTDEEVEAYEAKIQGRRKVLEALRNSVETKGTRVVRAVQE